MGKPSTFSGDLRLEDARDTDIVIPVIGDTGAGKSHFINRVLRSMGQKEAVVESDALTSCTQNIQPVVIEGQTGAYRNLRDRRIILVDCPGFDVDSNPKADFELLKRLSSWLKDSYKKGTVLGGIVYLHDITVTRSRPDGFQMKLAKLNQLYDDKVPFSAVVFVTSKWGIDPDPMCIKKEEQYKDEHWKGVLKPKGGEKGARVMRLSPQSQGSPVVKQDESKSWQSAETIIASILKEVEDRAVNGLLSEVQRIERNSMSPKDTQVAADLRAALEKYREAQEQITALHESIDGGPDSGSADGHSDMEKKRRLGEAEKDVQHLSQRIQKLASSLLDRLSRLSKWFFST